MESPLFLSITERSEMMACPQIKKDYLTLNEVATECDVQLDDLRYFGEEGKLTICLRHIPVKVAVEDILGKEPYNNDPKTQREILQMLEEPQALHPTDIYRIFANHDGKTEIKRLKTRPVMNIVKVIDPPLEIGFDDLVIMQTEKERFAHTFLKQTTNYHKPLVIVSPDFRNFILYDQEYIFGEKQARIIKFLYNKYVSGDPWVHSKKLLDISDAHSWRLQHLFNRHKGWRNVIKSAGNGYYMFNLPSDQMPPCKAPEYVGLSLFDYTNK